MKGEGEIFFFVEIRPAGFASASPHFTRTMVGKVSIVIIFDF